MENDYNIILAALSYVPTESYEHYLRSLKSMHNLALRAAELETELAKLNKATTVWCEMLKDRLWKAMSKEALPDLCIITPDIINAECYYVAAPVTPLVPPLKYPPSDTYIDASKWVPTKYYTGESYLMHNVNH